MSVDKLLEDLGQVLEEVKASAADKKGDEGQMVALYGMSFRLQRACERRLYTGMGQTSVGPYVVGKAAEIFLDTLYE
jgi:hypothetical protein